MNRVTDLSERVVLQNRIVSPDGAGGQSSTWVDLATVWAEVRPASATEGTRLGGTTTRRFIKVFIREFPGLVLPLQVGWDGKTLRVLAFTNVRGARTVLECEEVLQ